MSAAGQPNSIDVLITAGKHLRIEDYFSISAFVALVYDHLLTFPDEVEYIWKKKISPPTILYLINRYFGLTAFVICMVALLSPSWTIQSCSKFAIFEGILTLVSVLVAEAILILRVYAIYARNKIILAGLLVIWAFQLGIMSYILHNGSPVVIPRTPITFGCVLASGPNVQNIKILFIVPSLIFDSLTFCLLMWGILRSRHTARLPIARLMLKDGIIYFLGAFIMNVAWTTTGVVLPRDLEDILAFPSTAATIILIGHLTLNLKAHSAPLYTVDTDIVSFIPRKAPSTSGQNTRTGHQTFATDTTFVEMDDFSPNWRSHGKQTARMG